MSVPLLDLSKYNPDDLLGSKEFLDGLYKAMTEVGFFYVTNHGVPLELQTKAMQVIKTFFELPLEEKLKIELKNSPHFRGYSRLRKYYAETTDYKQDNREQLDLGREYPVLPLEGYPVYAHLRGPNQWPQQVPHFKETILELIDAMSGVGLTLLRAMVQTLHSEHLLDIFGDDYGLRMKLLRYPALNNPINKPLDHGLGVGPHKDTGFLTVLLQDPIGGLQVQTQQGQWINAEPVPNTFVVNIGEIFERLTKGAFVATTHRVVNKDVEGHKDRYSIPLFLAPSLETKIPQIDVISSKKEVVSDVNQDQLLQHEIYGINELYGYLRSHKVTADTWYYFDEQHNEWQRKPIESI